MLDGRRPHRGHTMSDVEIAAAAPEAPNAADAAHAVFEFERLHDVSMHEAEVERKFVGDLLAVAPKTIARMTASVAAGNAAEVYATAHALKGHCLMLGANALGLVCGEIEHDARDGHLDRGRELLARAELELIRMQTVLDAYFEESAAAAQS